MIIDKEVIVIGNRLYRRVDKTLYEIVVKTAESANKPIGDALARFVANEIVRKDTEESDE